MSKHVHGYYSFVIDRDGERILSGYRSLVEARRNAVEFNKTANPKRIGRKARYYAESARSYREST